MSRYWLDWFAEHAMEVGNPSRIERGQKPYASHIECFNDIVRQAFDIIRNSHSSVHPSINQDSLCLIDKMAPFGDVSFKKPPLAVSVTDAPHPEIFAHDNDVVELAKEAINVHSSIYLDLDRVFMMPGGVFQVRALFITGCDKFVKFNAILTRPGSNKGWLFAWLEGHHARHPTNELYDDVWAPELWMIADASRPINRKKIDYRAFADLERLAFMTIANWATLKRNEVPAVMVDFERYPAVANQGSVPAEAMAEDVAQGDRIGEMPMSESIFDVVVLPALGEERIRQIRSRVSGLKYQPRHRRNCAHTVDGFWRMQAYGPGRKLRKQVWINGFKRGHGSPKPIMNSLPREYRAA